MPTKQRSEQEKEAKRERQRVRRRKQRFNEAVDWSKRPDSDRCGAQLKRKEGKCGKPAGWGTDHVGYGRCKLHAGGTPGAKKVAAVQEAVAIVEANYGKDIDIDPQEALLEEVRRTAGHVRWLREKINEIAPENFVWGISEQVDKKATEFEGVDTTWASKINTWLELYHRERAHLVKCAKAALDAGVAERQVTLAEQQGAIMARVLQEFMVQLGLTTEQQQRAPELARKVLLEVPHQVVEVESN